MSDISFWIAAAAAADGERVISSPGVGEVTSVRFARFMTALEPGTVYVGTPQEVYAALAGGRQCAGATFFVSGESVGLTQAAQTAGANLVASPLDIVALHDALSRLAARYRGWAQRINDAANRRLNIQDVIQEAAEIARMPLFFLNSKNRVLSFAGDEFRRGQYVTELLTGGSLSPESARELLGEDGAGARFRYRALERGGCWVRRLGGGRAAGSLLLFYSGGSPEDFDAATLLFYVNEALDRIFARARPEWAGADFKSLLDDILSQRVSTRRDINHRFALLSRVPQRYCSFIIVDFDQAADRSEPDGFFLSQLADIFPDSNIAVYGDSVVLLLSRPGRDFQPYPLFDFERFSALLAGSGAFAAISNATSRREMLRVNYLMTRNVLSLGIILRDTPASRVFYFEDYAEYFVVDLCYNSFVSLFQRKDIIYLAHPAAITLSHYDNEHGTNLMEVLYHYCATGCNLTQTAKAVYMHRNTAASRIAKIRELVRADLNDAQTRRRLIFSYKILMYCKKYANVDLSMPNDPNAESGEDL